MSKHRHAHSIYCPSCSGLEVVEGRLESNRFFPSRNIFRALMGRPVEMTRQETYACLTCGLTWNQLDPRELAANASRFGLAPHRTTVMKAVKVPKKA